VNVAVAPGRLASRISPLLRETAFRRYWGAQSISLVGDQITSIALPLATVLALHASPAEMGYLSALVWHGAGETEPGGGIVPGPVTVQSRAQGSVSTSGLASFGGGLNAGLPILVTGR
jgi:hypothetical protein